MLVALIIAATPVMAGTFEWVTVDGNSIPNGGACNTLDYGSEVIGAYNPNEPWQAILDWKIDSVGTWHSITTYQALNGRLEFRFTVTDDPLRYDGLTIRAFDTDSWPYGGPFFWTCTTV